jgi:hypothetical protein
MVSLPLPQKSCLPLHNPFVTRDHRLRVKPVLALAPRHLHLVVLAAQTPMGPAGVPCPKILVALAKPACWLRHLFPGLTGPKRFRSWVVWGTVRKENVGAILICITPYFIRVPYMRYGFFLCLFYTVICSSLLLANQPAKHGLPSSENT